MLWKWIRKSHNRNTSDNNISISTSTDVLYDIGISLGEIKSFVKSNENRLNKLESKVNEHHKRIKKLEKNSNYLPK